MATKALKTMLFATGICVASAGAGQAQGVGFVSLYAVIKANGGVQASSGLDRSRHFGIGAYLLYFTREVTACAVIASPNGTQGGQASVQRTNSPNRIRVITQAADGSDTDLPFTATVTCSP